MEFSPGKTELMTDSVNDTHREIKTKGKKLGTVKASYDSVQLS